MVFLFRSLILKKDWRKTMKTIPRKETHYDKEVFVNPTTEPLRKTECLCLNCGNLKPGQSDNCPIAQAFYKVCFRENVALMVTRCPLVKPIPIEEIKRRKDWDGIMVIRTDVFGNTWVIT
jgi:hypothetical protein